MAIGSCTLTKLATGRPGLARHPADQALNQSPVLRECDEETALRECLEALGPAAGHLPLA